MEPVPQAHGETLLTQAPAAVNEIYPNGTGARGKPSAMEDNHKDRGKPSAMPNRNAHAQQQKREHRTGNTRTSPNI